MFITYLLLINTNNYCYLKLIYITPIVTLKLNKHRT